MNKGRFIELLNLYLDGELDPASERELIEAMNQRAEYKRIYLQYCRLNKACAGLEVDGLLQRRGPTLRTAAYAMGGLAAALAFLVLAGQNALPLWRGHIAPTDAPGGLASASAEEKGKAPPGASEEAPRAAGARSFARSSLPVLAGPNASSFPVAREVLDVRAGRVEGVGRSKELEDAFGGAPGGFEAFERYGDFSSLSVFERDPFNAFDSPEEIEEAPPAASGGWRSELQLYEPSFSRVQAVSAAVNR